MSAQQVSPVRNRTDDRGHLHEIYYATREREIRDFLISEYRPLAMKIVNRMSRATDSRQDVMQVAMIALLAALDRFDPSRGVQFATFAWATIEGSIKRHYRDTTWGMHVSRGLQERSRNVRVASADLFQELGAAPTVQQLAGRVSLNDNDVIEVLEFDRNSAMISRDAYAPGEVDPGLEDISFERIDTRQAVKKLLQRLDNRERQIVRLRFIDEMSQSEIAAELCMSQMHVSRLLARCLAKLRDHANEDILA